MMPVPSPDVENVAGTQVGLGASDPHPKSKPLDPPVDGIASAKPAGYTSLTGSCRPVVRPRLVHLVA